MSSPAMHGNSRAFVGPKPLTYSVAHRPKAGQQHRQVAQVNIAVSIQIGNCRPDANAEWAFAPHRDIPVRDPFQSFAVLVFKPGVGANHINIAISIKIRHAARRNGARTGGPMSWRVHRSFGSGGMEYQQRAFNLVRSSPI